MSDLSQRIDALRASLPQGYLIELERSVEALRRAGLGAQAPAVGDLAPDFALRNRAGALVVLHDCLKDGPVVLNFYRGEWCPICMLEMSALERVQPALQDLGARVLSISPEDPAQRGAQIPSSIEVLHDPGFGVGLSYGLLYRVPAPFLAMHDENGIDLARKNASASGFLPLPASYVIGQDGRIALAFVDVDYTRRLDPDDLVTAVRGLAAS